MRVGIETATKLKPRPSSAPLRLGKVFILHCLAQIARITPAFDPAPAT
jgi:hypothetical protein